MKIIIIRFVYAASDKKNTDITKYLNLNYYLYLSNKKNIHISSLENILTRL